MSCHSRNPRASFASIGGQVGLSPHGTADRVRRLERDGVITGYTAKVDPGRVGRSVDALVDVRLLPATDPDQFERLVASLPAVRELVFLTGRFDYQLRSPARTPRVSTRPCAQSAAMAASPRPRRGS